MCGNNRWYRSNVHRISASGNCAATDLTIKAECARAFLADFPGNRDFPGFEQRFPSFALTPRLRSSRQQVKGQHLKLLQGASVRAKEKRKRKKKTREDRAEDARADDNRTSNNNNTCRY